MRRGWRCRARPARRIAIRRHRHGSDDAAHERLAFLEAFAKLPISPPPVVFVMTAYDDSAFRRLDATIVHGFIRKPFDMEQVSQTVIDCAHLLQEKIEEAEANRRRARESAPDAPLRVLIAEDDPDYRAWVVAVARRLGCTVDFARDGAAALEQLTFREYDIAVLRPIDEVSDPRKRSDVS